MRSQSASYHGYRFPPDIISHAVWLYYRFCLSFRDAEDLLAQRGMTVTYETIRQWCQRFGRCQSIGRGGLTARCPDVPVLPQSTVGVQSLTHLHATVWADI